MALVAPGYPGLDVAGCSSPASPQASLAFGGAPVGLGRHQGPSWRFLGRCGRGKGLMSLLVALCAWVGPDQTHTGERLLGHRRSGSWGSGWRPWGTVPTALLTEPCHPSPLQLAPGVNSGQGLGIEIIGTLQLVLCVLATTDRRRRDLGGSAPLAIGFSVALGHLLAIDYTGCGINPARSFGSAVITHNFQDHWVIWVGPFNGGAMAVLIYDFILAPRSSDLTDRVKVWTSGQVEEYDLDGDDINSRVEMKPK
uniref:Aquaporin-1 n=1 Tax=Sus scrofa TaxID=9823 RepID=A0A480ZJ12_PIG